MRFGILFATLMVLTLGSAIAQTPDGVREDSLQLSADRMRPTITDRVRITTNYGIIDVDLFGEDAPFAVKNFVGLSDSGFFDGTLFHRVVPGFVVQAGDPTTRDTSKRADWGTGGGSIFGATFKDELNPSTPSYRRGYVRGTVAMANRGPNTNSSQFFIALQDLQDLPRAYTIFGQVTPESMAVVDTIAAVPLSKEYRSQPEAAVVIESTVVLRDPGDED